MKRYDIAIIGAGPSGYAAAMRALDFKKKTLLIERNKVGRSRCYQRSVVVQNMVGIVPGNCSFPEKS